ncbi:hypothetical protein SLA2020_289970 [Shorea laevis]
MPNSSKEEKEREEEPGNFAADATGEAGDNAGEVVDRRQRQRILDITGRYPPEQHLVYDVNPASQPFHPSQCRLLRHFSSSSGDLRDTATSLVATTPDRVA